MGRISLPRHCEERSNLIVKRTWYKPDCLYDPFMVLRSEIVTVAEPFLFASFSFVNNGGIVDNTSPCALDVFDFLAWPCEKIRQAAEVSDCRAIGSPLRRFTLPPVNTATENAGHYLGHKARILQAWHGGQKL